MKICSKCGIEKSFDEFHKSSRSRDGVNAWCKSCIKIHSATRHKNNAEKVRSQKVNWKALVSSAYKEMKSGLSCEICGEKREWCLDFHHKDQSSKDFNISSASRSVSVKRMMREVEKCSVLCSNCHRDIHHKIGLSAKI